mgnify:CR=1 FL=1
MNAIPHNGDDDGTIGGYIGSLTFYAVLDRKSTRLNSSHTVISYAVFCLKKKKKDKTYKTHTIVHDLTQHYIHSTMSYQ